MDILVVTGGTSGLGYEILKKAIKRNIFCCNISRNKEKMKELEKEFPKNYKGFIGDITDENFINDTFKKISTLGNIRYLINAADKGIFKKPLYYTKGDIDISLMGLKGMIICTTSALNVTNEENIKIINIMSSASLKGNPHEAVYCANKWGQRGYTESLKAYYKNTSVKIIGVYPGGMNSNFWNNNRDYVSKEKADTFMKPSDVAQCILTNILDFDNLTVADIFIERN